MRFQKYPDSSGRCLTICVTTISFLCIMFGFTIHTNTLLRFPIANYQLAMIYWNCSKNSIQVNRRSFSGCCPLFHFKIQFSKYPISVVYTNSPKPSDTKTEIYSGERFKKDAVSVTAFTGFVWTEGRFMFKKIYPLSKLLLSGFVWTGPNLTSDDEPLKSFLLPDKNSSNRRHHGYGETNL